MIEVDRLTKKFGPVTAVDDVSFDVGRGEVLGFLGPNGAGKSTTMKMITGFLAPTSGTVRIAGADVRTSPLAGKRIIGYLPEGAPMWPDMTPRGFLAFIAKVRGYRGAEAGAAVARAVGLTQLAAVLDQPIDTLSKGFKRRVGLAQALLHDPDVLILDEPTDGLDPNQKHDVRKLITDMAGDKAIVISTHILEEVEAVCTRAIIVAGGRVVADATPAALLARSRRHNAVTVRLAAGGGAVACEALSTLPDVAAVETPSPDTLFVLPRGGAQIVQAVGDRLRQDGLAVSEISVERGQLDEVFRAITLPAGAGPRVVGAA